MAGSIGVLVYCETADGKLASIATELLGIGNHLAKELGQNLGAVLIGSDVSGLAQEAIAYGANKVYVVDDPCLKDYLTDSYLQVMDVVVRRTLPQIVVLPHTYVGSDLAPRLAFRLDTAATTDCVALSVDPATKRMHMTKPVYGGKANAIYGCECDPQIATVRSKVMSPSQKDVNRKGEVINIDAGIDPTSERAKVVDRKVEVAAGVKLEDAGVVGTGGRGIGGPEGFKQLEDLARLLQGAVGASRAACDSSWVPDSFQVGLTGKIVSPDIYIAVGLSGSTQHLAGCSGSRVIVAINTDPEANIFKVAHYGIVADWRKAVPAFTDAVKQLG